MLAVQVSANAKHHGTGEPSERSSVPTRVAPWHRLVHDVRSRDRRDEYGKNIQTSDRLSTRNSACERVSLPRPPRRALVPSSVARVAGGQPRAFGREPTGSEHRQYLLGVPPRRVSESGCRIRRDRRLCEPFDRDRKVACRGNPGTPTGSSLDNHRLCCTTR